MYDVVALGELLIDFTYAGTDADGYPTLAAHPGGAPGNLLAALNAYGCKTAMVGKVGADAFGDLLLHTLEKAGIDTRGVVTDPEVFTTLAFVTLDRAGERTFSFARKPGADTRLRESEVPWELIDSCRDFHFGSLSLTDQPARAATQAAVDRAGAGGKWISFDPNLRPSLWKSLDLAAEQILWGLRQADIVKISGEEVRFLWDCGPEEGARRLHEACGVKLAFVTLGSQGCYVSGNGFACHVPSLAGVKAVDATGAGDIFGGAVLSRLLRAGKELADLTGEDLRRAAAFACAAAGLSTQRKGGMSSAPTLREVLERLG